MKYFLYVFMIISLSLTSCGGNSKETNTTTAISNDSIISDSTASIVLPDVEFNDNWDTPNRVIHHLSEKEFADLQLSKLLPYMEDFEIDSKAYSVGKTLISTDNMKILSIIFDTDNEVSEYLVSYDEKGDMRDRILVAYEDCVEGFSVTSGKTEKDKIIVTTVNYLDFGNGEEREDTTITNYKLSSFLEFEIIEN